MNNRFFLSQEKIVVRNCLVFAKVFNFITNYKQKSIRVKVKFDVRTGFLTVYTGNRSLDFCFCFHTVKTKIIGIFVQIV